MTNEKKQIILDSLIEMYLKALTPVGSNQLKSEYELPFSSSTIRNYFKKLDNDGLIIRVHISSGSIPSLEAMRSYWQEKILDIHVDADEKTLKKASNNYDTFTMYKPIEETELLEVLELSDRYLILGFDKKEFVFAYNDALFHLFNSLRGYTLREIKKVLRKLSLFDLANKLDSKNEYKVFNEALLFENFKKLNVNRFLNGEMFQRLSEGLSFKENFLSFRTDAVINNQKAELLCVGDVYNDYEGFFDHLIKEEV